MLKNNILANLVGNTFTAIVFLVCIPIYVRYLGVEAYGLIGFFASLQVVFSVLDAGLSATLSREFARLSVSATGGSEQKNLLKTFETIYFAIATCIGLIILSLAPVISKHWLSTVHLSPATVRLVLIQMGVLLALRWPYALYAGGLTGLQKQVLYNAVNTSGELVKAVGAIAVLMFVNNSIVAFFYWQIIITAITMVTMHFILWRQLPVTGGKPIFSKAVLKKNKSFAAGMGGTTLAVIILTQSDKIILSKILNLQSFGYYTLAYAIASSLNKITIPVSQAIYPRLVQLVHSDQYKKLAKLYHTGCQLIACFIVPAALTVIFFAKEIVLLWTRNQTLTEAVYPLVRVFIVGTACNALVTIPYMTQLAHGWAKFGLYQNIIAIMFLIPSIIYLTNTYGVSGAVWAWAILNTFYILVSMPIMFTKILKTEKWIWYWNDFLLILIPALTSAVLLRIIFNFCSSQSILFTIAYCGLVAVVLLGISIFSAKYVRENVSTLYRKFIPLKNI
jgi:O-antigen/teichoic acid export membrane protein